MTWWVIEKLFDLLFSDTTSHVLHSDYSLLSTLPAAIYLNTDTQKLKIIEENRNKSGVYQWKNNTNGNSYIGSSVDLSKRLLQYFNADHLLRNKHMTICNSLLKHGHSNFSLVILEYCDSKKTIEREQYYMDLLKPEYNLLKFAGSSLGFKHTEETLVKLRDRIVNEDTPKGELYTQPVKKEKKILCLVEQGLITQCMVKPNPKDLQDPLKE